MLKEIGYKLLQFKSEFAYRLALKKHAKLLPALSPDEQSIVDGLRQEGVYMTSLEKLGLASTPQLLHACRQVLSCIESNESTSIGDRAQNTLKTPIQVYTLTELSDFALWGSEQRLLSVIENYIGIPIKFQGIQLRQEFAHPKQFGAMLWHKDGNDRRSIKIIIYLSDVDKEHGPFEYIPRSVTASFKLNFQLNHQICRTGFSGISDEQIEKLVPRFAWKSCTGAAGTVIFVDTQSVFHHSSLRTAERSALFFVYTARHPKRPDLCRQYSDRTYPRPNLLKSDIKEASTTVVNLKGKPLRCPSFRYYCVIKRTKNA